MKMLLEKMDKIVLNENAVMDAIKFSSKLVNKHGYDDYSTIYKLVAKEFPTLTIGDLLKIMDNSAVKSAVNPTTSAKAKAVLTNVSTKTASGKAAAAVDGTAALVLAGLIGKGVGAFDKITDKAQELYHKGIDSTSNTLSNIKSGVSSVSTKTKNISDADKIKLDAAISRLKASPEAKTDPEIANIIAAYESMNQK